MQQQPQSTQLPLPHSVCDRLVDELRLAIPAEVPEVQPDQIRFALDMSGELRDSAGITVSCGLSGPHDGAHDVLSDVALSVSCWTHLDTDDTGVLLGIVTMGVLDLLQVADMAPPGWRMTCQPGPVAMSEVSTDGSYRVRQITATVYLQRLDDTTPEEED